MKVAKIIFALGIIFVLAGGIILVLTFNQEEKVEPLPEYEVPVVANTILEKQMVTTSDYKKKKMKLEDIPETIIRHENDLIGKCVKEGITLEEGQYFQKDDIEVCPQNVEEIPGPDYYETFK